MARPGMRFGVNVERTPQSAEHIGAGAPIGADGKRQLGGAWLDMRRGGGEELVADHGERHFAGGARGDRDGHAVARAVFRLVERDLEQVRRIGARFSVPA